MPESQSVAESPDGTGLLVLGVDTCGPTGSVALARIGRQPQQILTKTAWDLGQSAKILGQITLAGRTYSATLVAAIAELLTQNEARLADVGAIAVVHGPGSFTGVRVGLSAVKGLAEPGNTPVVAVSRLAVLAAKAGVPSAALDAHRHEVFLRLEGPDGSSRQLLAGAEDLAQIDPAPTKAAICDDSAASLLGSVWKGTELVLTEAPTAADAIGVCLPAILAGEFADVALLDGHYLRRSDAEIFGEKAERA
jgi:tRNA threonylcarbamoyladenosine biosynthesis protein TsaB